MSCAKIDPALHQAKKPDWIKVRLPSNPVFFSTKALISDLRLHTVCEEAQCPNRWECWSAGTATFMIAGERCTRACGFCAVTTAKPFALEADEPQRVAEAVKRLRLKHIVITPAVRSRAKYSVSLKVLKRMKEIAPEIVTKSGLMLGLGETEPELLQAMDDLRETGVQVLTLGQYLRPTPQHLPVVEYITPEMFNVYGDIARNKGFQFVA